jgi:hypothetical protein
MQPRWIKLKSAAKYCDMDVATFDKLIRPYIDESPLGRGTRVDARQIDGVMIGKRKKQTEIKPLMNGFLLECQNAN